MHIVELEALHLGAVGERRMRRRHALLRAPHRARVVLVRHRAAQDPAPLELRAVERAAERIEDQELQPLAHLGRDLLIREPGDELRQSMRVGIIHSIWIPAARTTLPTRSSSDLMCAPNSSGVLPITSAPSSARRRATSGCLSALTITAFSRSTIGRGVPAGASMPYHEPASYSGKPDSRSVGT